AYAVTIDWGDGSPPLAGKLVSRGGGHFDVQAQTPHAFVAPGTYKITVVVDDGQGGKATATSEALVTNAPLASAFLPFDATEKAPFSGVLAIFSDLNTLAAPDSYSARVAWGDGTTTDGV